MTLVWIPGHEGFIGNETADELAMKGSMNSYIGPEPYVELSQGTIKTALMKFAKDKHQQKWSVLAGLRHSKLFIERVDSSWTKRLETQQKTTPIHNWSVHGSLWG